MINDKDNRRGVLSDIRPVCKDDDDDARDRLSIIGRPRMSREGFR